MVYDPRGACWHPKLLGGETAPHGAVTPRPLAPNVAMARWTRRVRHDPPKSGLPAKKVTLDKAVSLLQGTCVSATPRTVRPANPARGAHARSDTLCITAAMATRRLYNATTKPRDEVAAPKR